MKKSILSLVALAFVGTGALTMTSCSDDDIPALPPMPELKAKYIWDGVEYGLDATTVAAATNADNQFLSYNIGTESTPIIATRWFIYSYEGGDFQQASNGVFTEIFVPVSGNSVVYPNQSNDIYYITSEVVIGGQLVADPATMSAFDMKVSTWDQQNALIVYDMSVTFAEGTVDVEFDGFMDGLYAFPQEEASSSAAKAVKSLQTMPLTASRTIDLNNVQKVDNTRLVKVSK